MRLTPTGDADGLATQPGPLSIRVMRMLHPETPVERPTSEFGHAGFDYGASPEFFSGRQGEGPLILALDTNVVIHLTQRFDDVIGALGWNGLSPGGWAEPDRALQDLFAVWFWRHVSMHISELTIDDAKKSLTTERQTRRLEAISMFARDRWLRDWTVEDVETKPPELPTPQDVPPGRDGELVRDAVSIGAHAFVTFDRGIIRYDDALRPWQLRLCEPGWLLEQLTNASEFSVLQLGDLPPVADLLMLSELYSLAEDDE